MLLLPVLLCLVPVLPPQAESSDDLAPGEIVEGELGYQLDEFLTRLEGLGFAGVVGVEHAGEPVLVRGGSAWGSTFHPELSGDLRVHQQFLQEVVS